MGHSILGRPTSKWKERRPGILKRLRVVDPSTCISTHSDPPEGTNARMALMTAGLDHFPRQRIALKQRASTTRIRLNMASEQQREAKTTTFDLSSDEEQQQNKHKNKNEGTIPTRTAPFAAARAKHSAGTGFELHISPLRQSTDDGDELPEKLVDWLLASHASEIIHQFSVWDVQRDGVLNAKEFFVSMSSLGVSVPTEAERTRLFNYLKTDPRDHGVSISSLLQLKRLVDAEAARQKKLSLEQQQQQSEASSEAPEASEGRMLPAVEILRKAKEQSAGLFRKAVLRPLFGAMWKSSLVPHHALHVVDPHDTGAAAGNASGVMNKRVDFERLVPDASAPYVEQCAALQSEMLSVAARTAAVVADALDDVRRCDLRLEECKAAQPKQAKDAEATTWELRCYLKGFAHALQTSLIANARFTREDSDVAERAFAYRGGGSARYPRYLSFFHPSRSARRISYFSRLCVFAMVFYLIAWPATYVSGGGSFVVMGSNEKSLLQTREACELLWNACGLPLPNSTASSACTVSEDQILIPLNFSGIPPFSYNSPEALADAASRCDLGELHKSLRFLIPLIPLILLSAVLPIGLFYRNLHTAALLKLLVWTPQVPLILIQTLLRAAVLTSPVWSAADTTYALIVALEAWCLFCLTAVFCLMDAMRLPTPKLRIVFAFIVGARFALSLYGRSTRILNAEQRNLLPPETALAGIGQTVIQQFVVSIDWVLVSLLFGALFSTFFEPSKMALIKLRSDILGYYNWRDGYVAQMAVQSRQRDAWFAAQVADKHLRLKIRTKRNAGKQGGGGGGGASPVLTRAKTRAMRRSITAPAFASPQTPPCRRAPDLFDEIVPRASPAALRYEVSPIV